MTSIDLINESPGVLAMKVFSEKLLGVLSMPGRALLNIIYIETAPQIKSEPIIFIPLIFHNINEDKLIIIKLMNENEVKLCPLLLNLSQSKS
ncbi:MAG TPA: hypothetical protein VHP30_14720 [Ignavibacteriales bacterium]|nr:hypothetical protein [Ignavibacteriales bacterium]